MNDLIGEDEDDVRENITLNELLTPEQQEEAKDMAIKIGGMLGDAQRPVMQHALTLALTIAELVEFCPLEARESIINFFPITIRATLSAFEEHNKHKVRH